MAFGNNLNSDDDVVSEINMVPLIDVMLVMLIIFIMTVPVLTHSVKLDLPHAENQPSVIEPETIHLSITADGIVHWNESVVDETQLATHLEAVAIQQPQPEILLRGDRKVEYERVAQVMAAVQRAGVLKLGFVIDPVP